ncbi:hypothetical protein IWQ62_002841 [Dispira parvispora]|uniref:Vaculolar membrane protein-domain-containing protein n=1 Tax=Dispira parvispora TaxID=1520584 RepID=A0A9W8E3G2_9FUNG|nr:hypothetical protein IWQ62_002841 [Dispira parvispora]
MMHVLNLVAAHMSGRSSQENSNPCIWYFMNLVLDTTVGVYILYLYLKLIQKVVRQLQLTDMESGNYGTPPRVRIWAKQSIAFFLALLLMKLTVTIALAVFPALAVVGRIFLAPFRQVGDPRIQVVMVMLVVPLIMNIVQFWLIDQVVKQKHPIKLTIPDHDSHFDDGETYFDDPNHSLHNDFSTYVQVPDQLSDGVHSTTPSDATRNEMALTSDYPHNDGIKSAAYSGELLNPVQVSRHLSRHSSQDSITIASVSHQFEMIKSP